MQPGCSLIRIAAYAITILLTSPPWEKTIMQVWMLLPCQLKNLDKSLKMYCSPDTASPTAYRYSFHLCGSPCCKHPFVVSSPVIFSGDRRPMAFHKFLAFSGNCSQGKGRRYLLLTFVSWGYQLTVLISGQCSWKSVC